MASQLQPVQQVALASGTFDVSRGAAGLVGRLRMTTAIGNVDLSLQLAPPPNKPAALPLPASCVLAGPGTSTGRTDPCLPITWYDLAAMALADTAQDAVSGALADINVVVPEGFRNAALQLVRAELGDKDTCAMLDAIGVLATATAAEAQGLRAMLAADPGAAGACAAQPPDVTHAAYQALSIAYTHLRPHLPKILAGMKRIASQLAEGKYPCAALDLRKRMTQSYSDDACAYGQGGAPCTVTKYRASTGCACPDPMHACACPGGVC